MTDSLQWFNLLKQNRRKFISMSGAHQIPRVSGADPSIGHLEEFNSDPLLFLQRVHKECGEIGEFDLAGLGTILLVGSEAHEAVFRANEEQLSAAQAYQMMIPVFGEGIQYGAPPHIERQQLKIQIQGLKHDRMLNYAGIVEHETTLLIKQLGKKGTIDVNQIFSDLTLKTSTHCLLGAELRSELNDEFSTLYKDLENGIAPSSLSDPFEKNERLTKCIRARKRLEELIGDHVDRRRTKGKIYEDMLQVYMDSKYEDGTPLNKAEITGMVIWFMFAGHHTSANTTAWTLLEVVKNPAYLSKLLEEIDQVFLKFPTVTVESLRELLLLDGFIRESLRLHPPLNAITRRVMSDFQYKEFTIPTGKNIMICPYVSHKLEKSFRKPLSFNPERPSPKDNFSEIAFGGGRHKCIGNGFAILQVKTILATLLKQYTFNLSELPEKYGEAMPALILRPKDPCELTYVKKDGQGR